MDTRELTIRPFSPADQEAARRLILSGLVEHWGWLDDSKNPDLETIETSYASGVFLVAYLDDELVGTGAILPRAERAAEIVRMSVSRKLRRQGIGSRILLRLLDVARDWGCHQVRIETTSTWKDAVGFYQRHGFLITHECAGDTYFSLAVR